MHIHGQKPGKGNDIGRARWFTLFIHTPATPSSSQSMHVQTSVAVENPRQPSRQPISSPTQHHASVAAAASGPTCQQQQKGKKHLRGGSSQCASSQPRPAPLRPGHLCSLTCPRTAMDLLLAAKAHTGPEMHLSPFPFPFPCEVRTYGVRNQRHLGTTSMAIPISKLKSILYLNVDCNHACISIYRDIRRDPARQRNVTSAC